MLSRNDVAAIGRGVMQRRSGLMERLADYTVESPADMEALINQLGNAQPGNAQHMPYPHTSGDRQAQASNGKDPNELGALWEKQGPKGTYYTGEIAGQRVVVFPVTKRSSDRSPVFRVLKSNVAEGGQRQAPPATGRPTVEDIPF